MSSSTVTKPFITESWIHLQQHTHVINKEEQTKQEKYKLRTADTDSMSHSGIYDAFNETSRIDKKKALVKKYDDTRRKSTATDIKKATTLKNDYISSPRLRTLNTKKSIDTTGESPKNSPKVSHILQGRRQTLSGPLTTPKASEESTTNNNRKSKNGLIKLADILQDTLAEERRKLGLSNPTHSVAERRSSVRIQPASISNSSEEERHKSAAAVKDIVNKAYRRTSIAREKIQQRERLQSNTFVTNSEPRKRTLSTGTTLQPPQPQQRTKSIITPPLPNTPEANYMRPTLADQRRHSVANSPLSRQSSRRQVMSKIGDSPITSEDDKEEAPTKVNATKRKSILAFATARQKQQQTTPSPPQKPLPSQHEEGTDSKHSSGDESIMKSTRLRRKSAADPDSLLANRRMSRTESLKEGLPTSTSPSIQAARMARRKSVIKQESPVKKKMEEVITPVIASKNVVRKRGKTLPGSLAKPPTVQALQLPPMKVEPIRLNIPTTSAKRLPKSPSVKALNTSRRSSSVGKRQEKNTTPELKSSSSSSSAEAPKKSLSTRKAKGSSHLGISTARRSSMKTPSVTAVTPSKHSPVSASPRVRPKSTRRRSLGILDSSTKQEEPKLVSTYHDRKMSLVAGVGGSRKNSVASDTEGGERNRHRVISLHEKLEAMVAQHTIKEDFNNTLSPRTDFNHSLTPEERSRPQLIKESLLMWDKEMVEAFSPGVPKSSQVAVRYYGHYLSPFEKTEIHKYPEVYFVGHHAKKRQGTPDNAALNYGYDDERGDYQSVISDHLGYRYEIIEELGRGSFGQVVKCYDHKTASTVAIKLIRNKKRFYAQAKTEVKILSDLVKWDPEDRHHNVRMTDSFYFRNHLCIVSECLSMNLYEFIKSNGYQGFHITLVKRFTIQLLRSLALLYRHGVIHCDMKPENILLKHKNKSTIKVIDFGSSCLESNRVYTYIQSRFYRSPEIILGLDYSTAIDMWSLGCIIAELYMGTPMFPGENEQEQLACIMEVLGVPDPALIQSSERKHLFFDRRGEPRGVCNSRGRQRRAGTKTLAQALKCNDPLFLDFISQCLVWDPTKRMTPESAFQHEWILQSMRPPSVRPSAVPSSLQGNDDEPSTGCLSRENSLKPSTDTTSSEVM
ncbi:hypothetical protein BDB01DRAFT_847869 [Pilobolus umbonatus]|nr:hypothetical protein BDB01DRAFT_847869 [Pilobolus umbonatus]